VEEVEEVFGIVVMVVNFVLRNWNRLVGMVAVVVNLVLWIGNVWW
jgi:hypothetical protein